MLDAARGGSSDHNQLPSAMRRCEYLRYSHSSASNCSIENTRPMSIDRYVCGLLATAVGANLARRPEHLRVDFCVKSCELT